VICDENGATYRTSREGCDALLRCGAPAASAAAGNSFEEVLLENLEVLLKYLRWPIVFVFCIWLFRKTLATLLGKLVHVRADEKGFEATLSSHEDRLEGAEVSTQTQVETSPSKEIPQTRKRELPEKHDAEGWRSEMILSGLNHENEAFDAAFRQLTSISKDEISRQKDEILYYKVSHFAGRKDSIGKIEEYLTDLEVASFANDAIGDCYFHSNDFQNAVLFFRNALPYLSSSDRPLVYGKIALSLYELGKTEEAINAIIEGLEQTSNKEGKAQLFRTLADIYKKSDDIEHQAFALEKALEFNPNDSSLLFSAAYAYADASFNELSLLHYTSALWLSKDESAILNNLGVQYNRLKMPAKSVTYYERAEAKGNTLSSSNLANILAESGFVALAKERLEKAKEIENAHANVFDSMAKLSRIQESEEETEKKATHLANELRSYFLEFTNNKFRFGTSLNGMAGTWITSNNIELTFELKGEYFVASWDSYAGVLGSAHYRFSFSAMANAAKGVYMAMNRADHAETLHAGTGYIYIDSFSQKVSLAIAVKGEPRAWFFTTLERKR
jgi:tetratricopeptide (TPR) repeat protein